ncbi:MAG: preprotein translocase subunit SecY [Puniceicoccales bacterium]|jgi:preprotein translocase subunit SecY|nr:preprotein translocase subunit SecY [Puniceicoccales bacterium]
MFSAFVNCIKISELRQKIVLTLVLLFVARIGANIPLPGIDTSPLNEFMLTKAAGAGGLLGMFNMFTGGALMKGAIFGLGIMPYISASIILQLLSAINPSLARIHQEGESGRQRIAQYTRYTTILICIIQGFLLVMALANYPEKLFYGFDSVQFGDIVVVNKMSFFVTSTIFLTAGTMALVWLGDQITQYGIGNGVSLLIAAGILSSMPTAVSQAIMLLRAPVGVEGGSLGLWHGLLMLILLFSVVALMIAVTQADRRIPVQYVNRVVGRKMYGGQSSYLPLKINYSGVMPVIFASAILLFPQQIFAYIGASAGIKFFQKISAALNHGSSTYYVIYGTMILCFSYFWVSMMFRPIQIADDLKKNGGYVPGVRPGNDTAKFLDFVMTRLTLAGALFLTLIALLPDFVCFVCGIPYSIALFFGGTGTLIAVGVILDTMKQVEGYLLQKNYDGFMKKGRIRSRSAVDSLTKDKSRFFSKFKFGLWVSIAGSVVAVLLWAFRGFGEK